MIDSTDFDAFARAYPRLAALPPQPLEQLRRLAEPVQIPANRVLFEPQNSCHAFLLLLEGHIRVSRTSSSDRELLLYRLGPGESCILSVACLLGEAPYSARGTSESEVRGLLLPRPLFKHLLEASTEFREFIFQFFSARIAQLMSLLDQVAFRPLDQRLASLLLAQPAPLETTHQRLADELGSVREVISRILKHFEEQGFVRLERGLIHLLDRARLAQIAGELRDSSH